MKHTLLLVIAFCSLRSEAQNAVGQYIKDQRTGCMVWSDYYSPDDSITWSGKCKNNYADGRGVLRWFIKEEVTAEYTGQMAMGKPEGKGKYVFNGYGTMEGHFAKGMLNGKGSISFSNGGKIAGNFVNGNLLNLDGKYLKLLQKCHTGIKDVSDIYKTDEANDSLFYYSLVPAGKIKAVLVLFPSTGEMAENVISCNRILMQQACDNSILSVVVSANYNKGLELDTLAVKFFEAVFAELVSKYRAPADKFVLSGLSLGGENALQYTEMSRNSSFHTYLRPLAVIGVDPPVDMAHLYDHAKKEIDRYMKDSANLSESKKLALNEDYFLLDYFHSVYGGTPETVPEKYIAGSQFSRNQADGGNAKYLISVPVRLYSDPDILWQLKNKGRDYYDMNAANLSAMVNFLMQQGNKEAEFIPALGKGFRVDGSRHPHSWSIVDSDDCIRWLLNLAR